MDDETGLYYLRARYYDPTVGRFINEDTYEGQITDPLSLNLYAYCSNNPLKYIDPSGHGKLWNRFGEVIGTTDGPDYTDYSDEATNTHGGGAVANNPWPSSGNSNKSQSKTKKDDSEDDSLGKNIKKSAVEGSIDTLVETGLSKVPIETKGGASQDPTPGKGARTKYPTGNQVKNVIKGISKYAGPAALYSCYQDLMDDTKNYKGFQRVWAWSMTASAAIIGAGVGVALSSSLPVVAAVTLGAVVGGAINSVANFLKRW